MYELNIGEGISTIDELKSIIQRFLLVMMLAVILISLFIDIAFTRVLLKPLNNIISKKLLPVPSPSSFNFTPIPSSTAEFNQLDNRINEMMNKLKDTFQIGEKNSSAMYLLNCKHPSASYKIA
ncbi:MAG: hypothetical protein IPK10_14770 [Bacteroidetes bacterium]|nr:hypothetical protein [Bacteroidota bacterium]